MKRQRAKPVTERYVIDDYWLVMYRQRWIILLLVVASAVMAWFISADMIAPMYEGVAQFYVPQDVVRSAAGADAGSARLPGNSLGEAKGYVAVLQGKDAARKIASEFPGKTPETLRRDADFVVSRQGIISVYVRDPKPEVAAKIANRYVSYFNEFQIKLVRDNQERAVASMQKQLATLTERRQQHETQLADSDAKNNVGLLEFEIEELEARRSRYTERIAIAQGDLASAKQRVTELTQQLKDEDASYQTDQVVIDNPLMNTLRQGMLEAEMERARKEVELQPEHPEFLVADARYKIAKKELEDEVRRMVSSKSKLQGTRYAKLREDVTMAQVDQVAAEARLQSYQAADNDSRERIAQLPAIQRDRKQMQSLIVRDQQEMDSIAKNLDNTSVDMLQQRDAIVSVQEAMPPSLKAPVYPIPVLNAAIACVIGLIVGILYALLLEHFEDLGRVRRMRRLALSAWVSQLSNGDGNGSNGAGSTSASSRGQA